MRSIIQRPTRTPSGNCSVLGRIGGRDAGWLACTITVGHAFGGDLETVTLHTGLLAARHVLGAQVAVVAQGPGNLGTGSTGTNGAITPGPVSPVYGPQPLTPGGTGTLETAYSNFTSALQGLSANSGTQSARSLVSTTAQSLAQQLNTTTQGIQALRSNAEARWSSTAQRG